MKIEQKKKGTGAAKWEEHIAKKKSSGKNSGNTEIQRPAKKNSVKPLEPKPKPAMHAGKQPARAPQAVGVAQRLVPAGTRPGAQKAQEGMPKAASVPTALSAVAKEV